MKHVMHGANKSSKEEKFIPRQGIYPEGLNESHLRESLKTASI